MRQRTRTERLRSLGRGRFGERGAVTAEVAMVLPVLLVTVLFGVWVVGVVVANVRCIDAARDVARAVARGESPQAAQQIGLRAAPVGAAVSINRVGSDVRVVVSSKLSLDWALLRELPPISVKGEATIQAEPGTTGELP